VTALAQRPSTSKRLKYVVALRRTRVDGAQDDRPYIGLENIESATGRLIGDPGETDQPAAAATGDGESLSTTFEPGDVLFGKLRPYLAKAWVAAFPGRCTTELLVMQPVEAEPRFLRYVCLTRDFIDAVDASTFGSKMPRADWDFIGNMAVPVPRIPQQRAIAEYLDRETARLDALVAAKERVLGLLAEKRRALISRAVTRGLDPRFPLRDSGIPWLGEVPVHWEVKRLKHVGRAIIGLTFDPADTVTDGSGVLVLRASNVREQKIVLDDNLFVLMDIPETLRTREGDILICSRSGSRALIGKNALIDRASAGLTFGAFMTVFRSLHNEYLFYVFNSPLFDYQAGAFSTSTINQLTVETLNGMEVPLPPPSEQKAIVARLRDRTLQLDRVAAATEESIALLKERRAALIAAAVTGQVEVA
jgi:type I restriction enzyme, S subunit